MTGVAARKAYARVWLEGGRSRFWQGGGHVLYVDGREVAKTSLERTTPITFPEMRLSTSARRTPSHRRFSRTATSVPLKFTGKIEKPTANLGLALAPGGPGK